MNICKLAIIPVLAVLVAGCGAQRVSGPNPPLIIADAVPVLSATKRSVGIRVDFKNITQADYNYARFKLTAFDGDGNTINPKKGNRESAYVRLAGPITADQTKSTLWTNTWNSKNFKCVILDEVEIIFMDGSIELAKGSNLLHDNDKKACL